MSNILILLSNETLSIIPYFSLTNKNYVYEKNISILPTFNLYYNYKNIENVK